MTKADKKYAVITGGSSGLGFAFSKELAKDGYVPILIARRKNKLDEAVADIKRLGYEAYSFECDIASEENLTRVCKIIKDEFGAINLLLLNAGVVNVGLLADYNDFSKMNEDIRIDLWGTILAARIFLPLLKPKSKIIMISSAFGLIGGAGYTTYCAAKAGVINFAEALRRELLCKDISVHVACPADIDTPQYEYETKNSPDWMLGASAGRKSLLAPEKAARRILKKCKGKRFLIIINSEIALLLFLHRILPRRVVDFILDGSLPRPKIN
ncbi:MAG: SDR family NAD(P)-dependent oxidoreductase [Elusimicrobiota bacterium]